jgi:hypothetical protein
LNAIYEKLPKQATVSKEQLDAIVDLERECLVEEVIPRIKKILKPVVKNMNTSFRIDINYTPDTGLVINPPNSKRPYRRSIPSDETKTERKPRAKASILKVTFHDGRVIQHNKVAQTLVDVVEFIGFERVAQLNWTIKAAQSS